jgi:hypothetical protein
VEKIHSHKKNRKLTSCNASETGKKASSKGFKNKKIIRAESINENEFQEFYTAFENHMKMHSFCQKNSDNSTWLETCSSTCSNKNKDENLLHSTCHKRRKFCQLGVNERNSRRSSFGNFRIIPIPMNRIISVMNNLKQIEDVIEEKD